MVHSDLTAIITGPNADRFGYDLNSPSFFSNPASPTAASRTASSRSSTTGPARPSRRSRSTRTPTSELLRAGRTPSRSTTAWPASGSEILANRLGVGPMGNADAVDLKYEEFFLSSWAVGDPAMVVDVPANAHNQAVSNPDGG